MISKIPIEKTNIPPRFENAIYTDAPKDIIQKFEEMKTTRKGLYIWGNVGTGKTHMIYSLVQCPKEEYKEISVMILNAAEMLRTIRSQFDHSAENYYDDLFSDILAFEGLLILDDIGSEKLTEWVQETFYLIINKRYEKMKAIIFTSNLPPSQLADRIGIRIVSRIVEMSEVLELKGEDRRLKK